MKKINNIEKIKNFIHDEKNKNLIINQVSEDIGEFYFQVIKDISKDIEIKLLRETEDKNMNISNDLFIQREIKIYNMTNSNSIEKLFKRNTQKIIISDYKNYKKFLNKCETVNGYEFDNDIRYYLINYLKINNEDLINYCISQPYLTNSEVSKYAVNKNNYISDSLVYEIDNFILEIRKEIYSLKHKNINIKKLFFILKNEVKYKKFNFLTY